MTTSYCDVSDYAVIELLETKSFFSLPKIYREIIRSANISDKERCFLYEMFFDFLEIWRKGNNNNRLGLSVKSLAEKYKRSTETIRRYLRSLENANLIRKVLGTIKKDGKIVNPIIGVEFVLPSETAQEAITKEENRITAQKLNSKPEIIKTPVPTEKINTPTEQKTNKELELPEADTKDPLIRKLMEAYKSFNKNKQPDEEKNLPQDNKIDHSPQEKSGLHDNKTVDQLLDQDQFEELYDLIISNTDKNNYSETIDKKQLSYILKRFKKLSYRMGFSQIKQVITQMLWDINKPNWNTNGAQHKLNIILKMIQANTYRVYMG